MTERERREYKARQEEYRRLKDSDAVYADAERIACEAVDRYEDKCLEDDTRDFDSWAIIEAIHEAFRGERL